MHVLQISQVSQFWLLTSTSTFLSYKLPVSIPVARVRPHSPLKLYPVLSGRSLFIYTLNKYLGEANLLFRQIVNMCLGRRISSLTLLLVLSWNYCFGVGSLILQRWPSRHLKPYMIWSCISHFNDIGFFYVPWDWKVMLLFSETHTSV